MGENLFQALMIERFFERGRRIFFVLAILVTAGAGLGAISAGKVKIQLPPETRVSFDLRAPLPLT